MSFWSTAFSHTVLITGGASGIGLAFAKRLASAGHKVIVVGRRQTQLDIAKTECPALIAIQGDVSTEESRVALASRIIAEHPDVNVLINNAGIQNRLTPYTDVAHGKDLWAQHKHEIAINFEAPMHLSFLFIPHFLTKERAQIVNVTSGLAFIPIAFMGTYCATKAGAHSFTLSLRQQLSNTNIKVLEIVPPAVNTDLGGAGLHTFGEPLDEFADHIVSKMVESDDNIGEHIF
jgi:uncharacterized oxidoreductase